MANSQRFVIRSPMARVVNRVTVRKHGRYNQVGGSVRTHALGFRVHTFVLADGGLWVVYPSFTQVHHGRFTGLVLGAI